MKRIILAAILAAAFGVAHAQTVTSSSLATTSSTSVSSVVGNGYGVSIQKSGANAYNTSQAYANGHTDHIGYPRGTKHETSAASHGGTSSYVWGFNSGSAFGFSAAGAKQEGYAGAASAGVYVIGAAGAASEAKVGSASGSANINNGVAFNSTKTWAENESYGFSYKNSLFHKATGGDSQGNSGSSSYSFQWGAIGATGGTATQHGSGGGF